MSDYLKKANINNEINKKVKLTLSKFILTNSTKIIDIFLKILSPKTYNFQFFLFLFCCFYGIFACAIAVQKLVKTFSVCLIVIPRKRGIS